MIDYGEDKQIFGAPKITVGPLPQCVTALFLLSFLLSFFVPEFFSEYIAQSNGSVLKHLWTLLTGLFVFPESLGGFAKVPSGFWLLLACFLAFFLLRRMEKLFSAWKAWAFTFGLALLGALGLWGFCAVGEIQCSWPFLFYGVSGVLLAAEGKRKITVLERKIPAYIFYLAVPGIALVKAAAGKEWGRCVIIAVCTLAGAAAEKINEVKR